jgi:hypothetical protein
MKKSKTNILIYMAVNSEYPVQIRLARILKSVGSYEPVFCFDSCSHSLSNEIKRVSGEHFRHFELNKGNTKDYPDHFMSRLGYLPGEVEDTKGIRITDMNSALRQAQTSIRLFENILSEGTYKIVIISGNSGGYNSSWLVKAAGNSGIKVCALPYGMGSPDTQARKLFFADRHRINRPLNLITSFMYPRWKHRYNGRGFLSSPATMIWVNEMLDAAPYRPWSHNGGNADIVFVESRYMMDYNLDQGLDPERLHLTGALYDDEITRILKNKEDVYKRFCYPYGFNPGKKLILASVPPLMISGLSSSLSEFKTQEEALMAFLKPLMDYTGSYNIAISLHPRLRKEKIKEYNLKGISLVTEPLESIIALASLFISCQSSTYRMALGAGVPCLDYDFYRFRFRCFQKAKGLRRIESFNDYRMTLDEWLKNERLDEIHELAMTQSDYYGIHDGENHKRILEIIKKLTGKEVL